MKISDSESCSAVSDFLRPHGLYSLLNSPCQNTGVGSCSLLQGKFLTSPTLTFKNWFQILLYDLAAFRIIWTILVRNVSLAITSFDFLKKWLSLFKCVSFMGVWFVVLLDELRGLTAENQSRQHVDLQVVPATLCYLSWSYFESGKLIYIV